MVNGMPMDIYSSCLMNTIECTMNIPLYVHHGVLVSYYN